MSIKFAIVTVLALACIAHAAMVKENGLERREVKTSLATKPKAAGSLRMVSRGVSTSAKRSVRSAGSLNVVSRESYDDYDEEDFGDYDDEGGEGEGGDFGYDGGMDDEEPTKPAPKPKAQPTKPPSVKKETLHVEYTTKYPSNCKCILGKGMHNGVCYEFTEGKKCKGRPCKPSYVCIDGKAPANAVTCMRKKNTKKVVSNGDGTCKVKHVVAYGYVPYTA